METGEIFGTGSGRPKYLEFLVKSIVYKEVMGHPNTMWLHRMTRSIIVITNLGYKPVINKMTIKTINKLRS